MRIRRLYCLVWDIKRQVYGTLTSPWNNKDLLDVGFEVRGRYWTKWGSAKALKRKKNQIAVQTVTSYTPLDEAETELMEKLETEFLTELKTNPNAGADPKYKRYWDYAIRWKESPLCMISGCQNKILQGYLLCKKHVDSKI